MLFCRNGSCYPAKHDDEWIHTQYPTPIMSNVGRNNIQCLLSETQYHWRRIVIMYTDIYILLCRLGAIIFCLFFFHQNGYSAINVVVCNKSRQILLIYTPLVHYPVQLIYHSIYKHVDNEGESRSSLAIALIIHIMGLWNQICLGEPKNSYLSWPRLAVIFCCFFFFFVNKR